MASPAGRSLSSLVEDSVSSLHDWTCFLSAEDPSALIVSNGDRQAANPPPESPLLQTRARDNNGESVREYEFSPMCMVEGLVSPAFINQTRFDWMRKEVLFRQGDIVVSAYPKCGTTWMEQMVLLVLNKGSAEGLNPRCKNAIVPGRGGVGKIWPEACLVQDKTPTMTMGGGEGGEGGEKEAGGSTATEGDGGGGKERKQGEFEPVTLAEFAALQGRRVIKTHAMPHLIVGCGEAKQHMARKDLPPLPPSLKIVVILRNPKDACVSGYYHFAKNFYKGGLPPFTVWAKQFLGGFSVFGSWFHHARAWCEAAERVPNNVLVLRYEDGKRDPLSMVREVARFITDGGDDADEEVLRKCVRGSDFEGMRDAAECASHMRKGSVGDWRRHMTAEVGEAFDAKFQAEMAGCTLGGAPIAFFQTKEEDHPSLVATS